MSVEQDRQAVSQTVDALKASLDGTDLANLSHENEIEKLLDHIDDAYIQVKQFISKHGVNDWNGWGRRKWDDIERNEAALKRKITRLERNRNKFHKYFDRTVTVISVIFVAISAVAAAISAYYSFKTNRNNDRVNINSSAIFDYSAPNKKINTDALTARRLF